MTAEDQLLVLLEKNPREAFNSEIHVIARECQNLNSRILRIEEEEDRICLLSGGCVTTSNDTLPKLRSTLIQRRKDLAVLIDKMVIPEGLGDPGLNPDEKPKNPIDMALHRIAVLLAGQRKLPVQDDAVLTEEEEESEFQENLS